jgi:hypothetical protein
MKNTGRIIVLVLCLMVALALTRCGGSYQTVSPLSITPVSLPNGTLGTPYSQTLEAGGGVAPFTWAVIGALPHNLQLAPNSTTATISGTPDMEANAIAFSIKVTDSSNQSGTQSYFVSILAEPDTLSFAPAAGLSFDPQLIGTASTAQTATLTNTGSSAVVINNVAGGGDFTEGNTCGSGLAAGGSCTIKITFMPSQMGLRKASITVTDDTAGSPHLLALGGIGLTLGPNATLSATSLNFGSQNLYTATSLSITLSNYGTVALSVAGIAATTANFGETDSCAPSLASGASCTVHVTFRPTTSGNLMATLSVTDNAPDSPQVVLLGGTGVAGMCVPQGGLCYGPGPNHCCPAAFPHHAFCSNPTGWGTCVES